MARENEKVVVIAKCKKLSTINESRGYQFKRNSDRIFSAETKQRYSVKEKEKTKTVKLIT